MINKLLEWWRLRRAIKQSHKDVRAAAAAVLDDQDQASALALAKMKLITDAIAAGKPVCRNCLAPFEYQPRPFPMVVQLRAILMIPDSVPEPLMVCKTCEETAITTYNREATNIGSRNDGHPNLLLRRFG